MHTSFRTSQVNHGGNLPVVCTNDRCVGYLPGYLRPQVPGRNSRRLTALVIVALVAFAAAFAPALSAHAADDLPISLPAAPNAQIMNSDLEVTAGTVYADDVIVYAGDVVIRDGGLIQGSLVVYSGDIEIEEGGTVEGDVSAFSGDIDVAGRVEGSLASWSGDIDLADTAWVADDVSVLSGDIERSSAAFVGGSVIQGPSLNLPNAMPARMLDAERGGDGLDRGPQAADHGHNGGFLGSVGRFLLRLFGAIFFTLIVGLLAALAAFVKPRWVDQIERTARADTALSFIFGLLVNLALLFLSIILLITICLWPIPLVTLLVINLIGWTGISQMVGQRVTRWLHLSLQPALVVGVGAAVLIGVLAPLWAIGGCLRFLVWMVMLLLGSIGTGAFLLPWFNRWRDGTLRFGSTEVDGGDGAVVTATAAGAGAADSNAAATGAVPPGDVNNRDDDPSETDASRVIVLPPPDQPKSTAPSTRGPGEDDYTAIAGIGPVFDKRLKAAGLRTYAQLAALTPEQIADIIGWPPERVVRSEIIEQARALSSN